MVVPSGTPPDTLYTSSPVGRVVSGWASAGTAQEAFISHYFILVPFQKPLYTIHTSRGPDQIQSL
jgi:hypothetical protein